MQRLLAPVASELVALEPRLAEYLLTPNEPTNQVIRHIFASGGKRVRPALFLLTCQAIGYEGEHAFPIAAVCEYIHTASLLHDDVIDNSTVRRGKPTANSVWGDETAVLAGDLIYSAACRLMVKTASLPLIDDFAECIRFMSESELYQLDLLWKANTTRAQYERVVAGKTAALFEASCRTPCYLAGLPASVALPFGDYGRSLGFAFQIADDCLDYEGEEDEVGKSVTADLLEGKVTLPLILALALADSGGERFAGFRKLVSTILETGEADATAKKALVEGVHATGGLHEAKAIAKAYVQTGRQALLSALDSLSSQGSRVSRGAPAVESLFGLLDFVVERRK
ncbi:MAG: polyprenyl synthetase family protein [Silvanigrellales bacterium]|nr:polyprenyl synthetase family protein [Silvanigrellales bacterium]